ncbi:Putative bacterial antitoxin YdaS [uncultured Caudovirales phage]|uniref:Bacterial antitoxin YdaS n=1 Tax=uncultured Caudovirales phage TaxID=2100421 RepID=A0A6J5R2Z1_9CAUD|nr:Putative bacterial antitoxin YdaS [uncultured Caudovirales phage]CAB4190292.1 Putative bacterial antitoxin YdaS [uncultured Caudovirales phage]
MIAQLSIGVQALCFSGLWRVILSHTVSLKSLLSSPTMTTQDIIKMLGGPVWVSQHLGIRSQAVSNWKRIPLERVPLLLMLAKSMGVEISAEQMRPDVYWTAFR